MTKVIIIQDGSLESYYEQRLDYLQAKYHSHPSSLPKLSVDSDVESELGYYERLANNIAQEAGSNVDIPIGKLVI